MLELAAELATTVSYTPAPMATLQLLIMKLRMQR
jgi:hypothetical protein